MDEHWLMNGWRKGGMERGGGGGGGGEGGGEGWKEGGRCLNGRPEHSCSN